MKLILLCFFYNLGAVNLKFSLFIENKDGGVRRREEVSGRERGRKKKIFCIIIQSSRINWFGINPYETKTEWLSIIYLDDYIDIPKLNFCMLPPKYQM